MSHKAFNSDLTDADRQRLAPLLPPAATRGRPRRRSVREILDAIFDLVRSGCAWRLLPREFPPWKTVDHDFRLWRRNGLRRRLHAILRAVARVRAGRNSQPSAGKIDSHAVKTTAVGGPQGYDGGKKVNGRKQHLLVDTPGRGLWRPSLGGQYQRPGWRAAAAGGAPARRAVLHAFVGPTAATRARSANGSSSSWAGRSRSSNMGCEHFSRGYSR